MGIRAQTFFAWLEQYVTTAVRPDGTIMRNL